MEKNDKFDKSLTDFKNATAKSMAAALICSQIALQHFHDHGDVSLCQRFHDAMPKNYTRRSAFIKWLASFSPIALKGGEFAKDKSDTAVDWNLEAAFAKPFWEFAPEKEILDFTSADIISDLKRVVKKFKNEDRSKPADAEAVALLAQVETTIETLAAAPVAAPVVEAPAVAAA